MKNKMTDLRDHLFATLEALQDPDKPMEIERAKAIADVAKVLVDSAKVEVAFIVAMDGDVETTGFIESARALPSPQPAVRQ
jgi:5-formyltetrahydrofolate cyclo-ligase